MGGKVLGRRGGAALLAGIFLAAAPARGQTVATDQTQKTYGNGQTLAAIAVAEYCGEGKTLAADQIDTSHDSYNFYNHAAGNDLGASPLSNGESRNAELPASPTPAVPVDQSEPYTPITGRGRVVWVVKDTLWPEHLVDGALKMGIATALDEPPEDGPHWGGFAERFGVRLTSVAVNATITASVGTLWGEDPRYFRVPEEPFGARVKNVIKMTFFARRADGNFAPAYARFIGTSSGNFLSNAWRPDSSADTSHAVRRIFEGFAGHMAGNAWNEFGPDAKRYIFHHGKQQP
jgi:hypothetical protein